ncbi:MAG: HEAT repeat domain-containing protein [Planctomycetota bacterium]|jgi:HEAT repeat protein
MTRNRRIFLGFGALVGALLTAFLIVHLLGEDERESYARSRARTGEEQREEPSRKRRVVQSVDDEYRRGTNRSVSPLGTIRPGLREPFDSPETIEKRAMQSAELLDIIEKIKNGELDPTRNADVFLKMQKLVRAIGYRLTPATRNQLVEMIDTVEPKWRALIGSTLGNLRGDVETASILMGKLEQRPDNVYTRRALLTAITNMEVPEVLPRLSKMLGSSYDEEHLIARAIGRIGGEKAMDTLIAYLEKDAINPSTAREIERVLGAGGDPNILAKVEKGLSSTSARKRISMLNVLGAARKTENGPAIRELLKSEADPRVRQAAIRALGHIGDPESGAVLLELAERGEPAQRSYAINAIHTIKDPKTISALAKEWNRLPDNARYAVIGAAARLRSPTPDLVRIASDNLGDSNERVRNAAATVLGATRSEKHVDALAGYLRSAKTARERSVALRALERIGTEKAAEEVLNSLGTMPERQQESVRLRFERIRAARAEVRQNSERHR